MLLMQPQFASQTCQRHTRQSEKSQTRADIRQLLCASQSASVLLPLQAPSADGGQTGSW
jgi:hypothetical protein